MCESLCVCKGVKTVYLHIMRSVVDKKVKKKKKHSK